MLALGGVFRAAVAICVAVDFFVFRTRRGNAQHSLAVARQTVTGVVIAVVEYANASMEIRISTRAGMVIKHLGVLVRSLPC